MSEDKGNLKRKNITIDDIRSLSRLPKEKKEYQKNDLWSYFVLRKISYHPTWLFLKLGLSANQVTLVSLVIGIAGCILLAFGSYSAMIAGVLLLFIYNLLDHVDGNIARYNKSATNYGKFIDALTGSCITTFIFVSAGIGAFNHPDLSLNSLLHLFSAIDINKSTFLILGAWTSLCYILPRFLAVELLRIIFPEQQAVVAEELKGSISKGNIFKRVLYKIGYNISLGFTIPILLLATIFRFLSIFVFLYALLFSCAFIIQIIEILKRAKVGNEAINK